MNDRLKEVRKRLKLNQKELGEKIKLSQTHISSLENGSREVTDRIIYDLCRELDVNENWLRSGNGEMFIENDSTIIAELVNEYRLDFIDQKIIEHYIKLDDHARQVIKNEVVSLAKQIVSLEETAASSDDDIDEKIEKYRLELKAEKKTQTSSVLPEKGKGETS